MPIDRTKPPPFFIFHTDGTCFIDVDVLGVADVDAAPRIIGIDDAWEWYDRITRTARIELICELIVDMSTGRIPPRSGEYEIAEFRAGRNDAIDGMIALLGARADALDDIP